MKKAFKRLLSLTGIALLLWVVWFVFSMATAQERMTAICQGIPPGMSVHDLQAYAADHGLGPRHLTESTPLAYLAESRSFGRHACRVELAHGRVVSVRYNFAD
ncbi:MAG: hypothetical protein KBD60_09440 [Sterolibacterium sp.]|jgi:hypothetical protein|nr:hypothetical protein [Sterolibacterium sp.]